MSFRRREITAQVRALPMLLSACIAVLAITPAIRAQEPKTFTAEQIAETVIAVAGNGFGRNILNQIRRNGIERGRITRTGADGRAEETRYELRFVRGDKAEKDKIRLDTKTPQAEYTLVFSEGRMFGIINGSTFAPRSDATANFMSQQAHSVDALPGSSTCACSHQRILDALKARARQFISVIVVSPLLRCF